jgi:hypothetical protein
LATTSFHSSVYLITLLFSVSDKETKKHTTTNNHITGIINDNPNKGIDLVHKGITNQEITINHHITNHINLQNGIYQIFLVPLKMSSNEKYTEDFQIRPLH